MIECPAVARRVVRQHYDLTTLFYWLFWGRHIHHGLWQADESPGEASQQLTETLAREAGIRPGQSVLDIGCGMGGSSIHLARALDCQVTGITISPFQRRWAARAARWHGVSRRTEFRCVDAERVQFPRQTFDVLWSVECTEHLFDKPAFFRRAVEWLRPGGQLAVCAWLAGDGLESDARVQQVQKVCADFFCPSLGTSADYCGWLSQTGLEVQQCYDWTDQVQRTWEICRRRVRRSGIRFLAGLFHRDTARFLDGFDTILDAYRNGAMRYGCFIAHKPEAEPTEDRCDRIHSACRSAP